MGTTYGYWRTKTNQLVYRKSFVQEKRKVFLTIEERKVLIVCNDGLKMPGKLVLVTDLFAEAFDGMHKHIFKTEKWSDSFDKAYLKKKRTDWKKDYMSYEAFARFLSLQIFCDCLEYVCRELIENGRIYDFPQKETLRMMVGDHDGKCSFNEKTADGRTFLMKLFVGKNAVKAIGGQSFNVKLRNKMFRLLKRMVEEDKKVYTGEPFWVDYDFFVESANRLYKNYVNDCFHHYKQQQIRITRGDPRRPRKSIQKEAMEQK